MSRSGLKFLAILLGVLIVAVLFAGLDDLPRTVRAQIDTERATLASAQKQLDAAQAEVANDLATAIWNRNITFDTTTPEMTMVAASPAPNQPSVRCTRTLCARTSADCAINTTIHAAKTTA